MSGEFTHLHVASAFSTHYGTAQPETLVARAAELGCSAAALTDRDGLYGAVRHVRACIAAGIGPIVGVDIAVEDSDGTIFPVTVLAYGNNQGAGWAGLCRLISAAHAPRSRRLGRHRSATPQSFVATSLRNRVSIPQRRLPAFLLGEAQQPVCAVLLGPESNVGQSVLAGNQTQAIAQLAKWRQLLPDGVHVEVTCLLREPGSTASVTHAADLFDLAQAQQVPAVLTNAVRYLTPEDVVTGDVLDSADLLLPLGEFESQANGQAWYKPAAKMHRLGELIVSQSTSSRGLVNTLLATTEQLGEQCVLDPVGDLAWRQPRIPELSVIGIDEAPTTALWQRVRGAIPTRYPGARDQELTEIHRRLDAEMDTIMGFGFESYFLTVADAVGLIRERGIRHQARGSGAGSLVNYLLHISQVDPIEHDLLFERFLGSARSTLPDIDIDVESARRHEIYQALFTKYGEHRVTLLSMHNTYRARGAIRDAGLALGMAPEEIDRVAQQMWRLNAHGIAEALQSRPELAQLAEEMQDDPRLELLVELTARLDRLPRHISMHPCGVILSNQELMNITPVQPSGIEIPMSQFDKDDVDDVGLIKLDILGVRMQSAIAHSLTQIKNVHGPYAAQAGGVAPDAGYVSATGEILIDDIPHDDAATFELLRSTHTLGVFQLESPGQRELLGKMQPDQYEDLIADISLFRPGPMKGQMVTPFINAKHRQGKHDVIHPLFEEFLADSYGVVIYHEHVMRILHHCMGVSLAEADELRRLMEKRGESIEAEFRKRVVQQVDERGKRLFSDADVEKIWQVVEGFGSFGFCKAHGAAFALPTYQTAWLKTHYPAEFLCGLLEHDPGMYPKRLLLTEAKRLGIPILDLDVNVSTDSYVVERLRPAVLGAPSRIGDMGIRLSLTDVQGINNSEMKRIIAHQPFVNIADFVERARPSRRLAQRLGAVGALNSLVPHATQQEGEYASRAYATQLIQQAFPQRVRRDEVDDQPSLFDEMDPTATQPRPTSHPRSQQTPDFAEDRVAAELEFLSMDVSAHVIDEYQPLLQELSITPAGELVHLPDRSEVMVAGIRVATQTPPMRSGKRVVFISLDDGTGCADTTFFEDAQQRVGEALFGTPLLVIRGYVRRTGAQGVSVLAEEAWDLQQLWDHWQTDHKNSEETFGELCY